MDNRKLLETLLLISFNYKHDVDDPNFWGTAINEDTENLALNNACDLLGEDILENPECGINATNTDRYKTTINALLDKFDVYLLPESKKLFVVVTENPDFGTPESLEDLRVVSELDISLWNETNISPDAGWKESEAEELANLDVHQGVIKYGDFAHSIFRIR